ncbi:hypothetical protein IV454_24025 [Massilia antarctica]|uniref:Uncharacterized protein n=1 Tax=Massilia antarctica TaxID=2765360 RepID=A0AA48WBP8_9BURK|nr:hypothetical protein [Massilia antarctica]QPI48569.1 hypothetical protein IV454_24025 [Massilia antarctica]
MGATDSVSIDRLRFALLASAVPDRAGALLARLREVFRAHVPQAIARRRPDCGDPAYLFIERLVFDCPLNAAWSDTRLADSLAKALAAALAASEAQPARALAFRDRAEYLAAFLLALADGSAWRQWCFDEFDGLKLLPVSGALRTLLIAEGDAGRTALARLTGDALRRVLESLGSADAGRLLAHLLAGPSGAPAPPPATLLRLIDAMPAGAPRRRLAWLVALGRIGPDHASTAGLDALDWLDQLRQAARAGDLNALLDADLAAAGLLAACCRTAGLADAPLAAWLDADCAGLVARLRALAPAASGTAERWYCPHGGAWLLLVQLAHLGWWARWQARLRLASPGAANALAARLALAVVARALGGQACASIEADSVLRRALGIGDDPRAGPWTQGRQRLLANALALPAPQAAAGASVILGHGGQRRLAHIEAARGTIIALRPCAPDAAQDRPDAGLPATAAWWRAHDPLRSGRTQLERALGLNALNLLREFAARLPGCDEASPGHLRSQCLSQGADVAIGDGHITVHAGRAPLDVLLTLAGLKRTKVVLPDGRILALQPESAP